MGRAAPEIDFEYLSACAPGLAGDLAFRLFCVPRFSEYRTSDHDVLVRRARRHLDGAKFQRVMTHVGEVATYELLPDGGKVRGSILVVHGWTSEASFMMALAEPLRRSGFRVLLADCPAHGRSRGEQTNLVACAQAMVEVVGLMGPFDAIVAHSMGSLAAVMAGAGEAPLPNEVNFKRYCLIAPPNRFAEVTGRFSNRLGVSPAARRQFERQLERIAHMPMSRFRSDRFLRIAMRPTLVIHDRDDHEVPFHNAQEMVAAHGQVKLVAFEGLGHRKVLYAPPVVRAVVAFMREM
ncbi:MAG: alpha/beta hydrolase [Alphaproteobacteria bacterium]|nr:alpha/beta hydrolase [Alphaproteobacteria bacterium]